MKTYNRIQFHDVASIMTQVANGFAAVTGHRLIVSDMIYSLGDLSDRLFRSMKEPYYIAIREMGTESGDKEHCMERCKSLGYPLVIAKIETDQFHDINMTVMLTHRWIDGDNNAMEQEFNSL